MKKGEIERVYKILFWVSTWPAGITLFFITALLYIPLFPFQVVFWIRSKHSWWTTFPYMFLYMLIVQRDCEERSAKSIGPIFEEISELVQILFDRNYLNWVTFFKIFFLGKDITQEKDGKIKVHKHRSKEFKLLRFIMGSIFLLLEFLIPAFFFFLVMKYKQNLAQ